MGLSDRCAGTSSMGPQCVNVWRGVINGEIVDVEGGNYGWDGDELQGFVLINIWGHSGEDIYNTPQRVGPVRVVAVDGMRVTLAPVDFNTPLVMLTPWSSATPGLTFVFDLATRQWVSPSPGPSPSAMPTSGPSPFADPSPLPSPSP